MPAARPERRQIGHSMPVTPNRNVRNGAGRDIGEHLRDMPPECRQPGIPRPPFFAWRRSARHRTFPGETYFRERIVKRGKDEKSLPGGPQPGRAQITEYHMQQGFPWVLRIPESAVLASFPGAGTGVAIRKPDDRCFRKSPNGGLPPYGPTLGDTTCQWFY